MPHHRLARAQPAEQQIALLAIDDAQRRDRLARARKMKIVKIKARARNSADRMSRVSAFMMTF